MTSTAEKIQVVSGFAPGLPNTAEYVHTMDLDVQIFDTDCYGVMWHGAYIKWLEMGRVKFLEARGMTLSKPGEPGGYVYPVAEQNLKFKSPAPYAEKLTLFTRVRVDGYKLVFEQNFRSHTTGRSTLEAVTTVVVVDGAWKLQRRMPEFILEHLGLASGV